MAKNSIRDYSATNSSNTDIQSIDISEGCSPAGINNAIREVMADLKDVSTGAVALESPAFDSASLTGDLTFGDNDKAIFGAGSDLQIFSDGSDSYISEGGTGDLKIQGANVRLENPSGVRYFQGSSGVSYLYNSGDIKLNTTATGVDVKFDGGGAQMGIDVHNQGTATDDDAVLTFETQGSRNFTMGIDRSATSFVIAESSTLTANQRLVIDDSGNVLIGVTATGNNGAFFSPSSNDRTVLFLGTSTTSTSTVQAFRNSNGTVGTISVGGSATSYNTSSDYRLKENVTADWDATTRLKQLNPVRFNFISDADTIVDGFLAHEVQDIVPEAISGTKDAMRDEEYEVTPAVLDEDGNVVTPAVMGTRSVPEYQGIDQSKLVPLLVKTIQELEARVAALENA